jgi:hypothetical protein
MKCRARSTRHWFAAKFCPGGKCSERRSVVCDAVAFRAEIGLDVFYDCGGSLRECGRRESKNNDAGNESDEVRSHDKN